MRSPGFALCSIHGDVLGLPRESGPGLDLLKTRLDHPRVLDDLVDRLAALRPAQMQVGNVAFRLPAVFVVPERFVDGRRRIGRVAVDERLRGRDGDVRDGRNLGQDRVFDPTIRAASSASESEMVNGISPAP